MLEMISRFPLWQRLMYYMAIVIAAVMIIAIIVEAVLILLQMNKEKEAKKREGRRNLRSPDWADTMMYWRSEKW